MMKTSSPSRRAASLLALALLVLSPSALAQTTPQDPWSTDALQFTEYLPAIQAFPTTVKPASLVPDLSGSGRAARRAHAQQVASADARNLKAAKRAVNDLQTLRERALRDSTESRDNRNTLIESTYELESTRLDGQHNSDAAAEDGEYTRQLNAAQQGLEGQLNANETGYNAAVVQLNNSYGAGVDAQQSDFESDVNKCANVPAKPTKPSKGKKESAAAYKKRLAAYKKRLKAYATKYARYKNCLGGAQEELDNDLNGSEASADDGLSGALAVNSVALDLDKQQRDQAAQAAYDNAVAALEAKFNGDRINSDTAHDIKTQLLQSRRENAIVRSERLLVEEGDVIADSFRQSIRLIEDTYNVSDDDLGVDSSES